MALQLQGTYAGGNAELWIDLDAQGRVTGGEFRNNTDKTGQLVITRDSTGVEIDIPLPPGVRSASLPPGRRFKYDDLLADWSISVALRWP